MKALNKLRELLLSVGLIGAAFDALRAGLFRNPVEGISCFIAMALLCDLVFPKFE